MTLDDKAFILFLVAFTAFMIVAVTVIQVSHGSSDCKTSGTKHGDNSPSEKQFKKETDFCQMAKCVDSMNCSNGDKMSKQQYEKIYATADMQQKKCLTDANQDGHGKDGVVGYEVLYCVHDKD